MSNPMLTRKSEDWDDQRPDAERKVWSHQLEKPTNMPTPSLIQQANIYVTQVRLVHATPYWRKSIR